MALHMDAEIAAHVRALFAGLPEDEPPPVGDWQSRRDTIEGLYLQLTPRIPVPGRVAVKQFSATAPDGAAVPLRLYTPVGASDRTPLVVYAHGGGMFCCSLDTHDRIVRSYAAASGVRFLAVDYRYAPENPFPASVDDIYASLVWAVDHADELGVDPERIAIAGDSAGAGMAAGVALMCRDRGGPQLALQVLIQPMLDDRTTSADPELEPWLTWSWDDNVTGWGVLLGDAAGGPDVSTYAAPARATDLAGLAPAYLEVGTLDIFHDETRDYAARLAKAGVPAELHVWEGAPHAFEIIAYESTVGREAIAARVRAFASLVHP